ncbi:hypothetical protein SODALDRAFT_331358 [Sodiomyces alkalinus F11]|uniref:Uncharacterized protein n=1 Tax=Sodiomyces alkalinus (strain CBS 110278 / VKM F-3762 / F11) TaxID=1314773 RepID=A0A3N2Q4A0_SODAK|nr:hypothetical protein SODALDRAFT_331358 [Sodiomyces alkalinus F11]ROT41604.1 hypothetical protein SODALDRAFT_331358 [Sodiomyces alkalinus F11]
MTVPAKTTPTPKILFLGATGYLGGTLLHRLLASDIASAAALTDPITVLVRGEDRAAKLASKYGPAIKTQTFDSLDETDKIQAIAASHDIVINAGTGFHPGSAEALIRGLGERKASQASSSSPSAPTWMIHTSGVSNIADRPVTGTNLPDLEFSDSDPLAVLAFEEAENKREWYPQRTAELTVLRLSDELGVPAVSLQVPCIFGEGQGLFQDGGVMIPIMMAYVLDRGYGFTLGDGTADVGIVHVQDLADCYIAVLRKVLFEGGKDVPTGRKGGGVVYPVPAMRLIDDIARGCLDVTFARGLLPKEGGPTEKELRKISIEEAATTVVGSTLMAEVVWGAHRKTTGTVAKEKLGWKPVFGGPEAWNKDFEDELDHALSGKRGYTFDVCIANRG